MARFKRRSTRLGGYNYSEPGAYFVTVCVRDRKCLLGEVKNGTTRLNQSGKIVLNIWNELPGRFPFVEIDEFVVMPNHIHGIIVLIDDVGAPFMAPGENKSILLPQGESERGAINRAPTLGNVVRAFKGASTRLVRASGLSQFSWQRNYYEHVIRNESELFQTRQYIQENPLKWDLDPENPSIGLLSSVSV